MNILALDACLDAVSVALRWQDGRGQMLLRDVCVPHGARHAERLFPMVADLMGAAPMTFQAVDRIAATVGPGSFTGVRVGVAAARALALATGKPTVGMTSLRAMALSAATSLNGSRAGRRLVVAVDARRAMSYVQLFTPEGAEASAAMLLSHTEAAQAIGSAPVVVVGSAAPQITAAVCAAGGSAEANLASFEPHARVLALVAHELAPAQLEPLYLRPSDARPQHDKSLPRVQP